MDLNQELHNIARQNGITYFGVADLSAAHDAIAAQGGEIVAGYRYSITIGIALIKDIVDKLPQRSNQAISLNYRHHAYNIINYRLDLAASLIGSFLQDKGCSALPIPASEWAADERICSTFSHKLAARLAGLGWIGKSCLLVTPGHGPRVRWTTILANAPLVPTGVPMEQQCGTCTKCIDICPVKAYTGRPFKIDEPREARYDVKKCQKYFDDLKNEGKLPVCGMCLYVCPHGRK